jgi:hypothetical protein
MHVTRQRKNSPNRHWIEAWAISGPCWWLKFSVDHRLSNWSLVLIQKLCQELAFWVKTGLDVKSLPSFVKWSVPPLQLNGYQIKLAHGPKIYRSFLWHIKSSLIFWSSYYGRIKALRMEAMQFVKVQRDKVKVSFIQKKSFSRKDNVRTNLQAKHPKGLGYYRRLMQEDIICWLQTIVSIVKRTKWSQ